MPFTEQEIAFMQKIGVKLDFSHPETISDDEWIDLEEAIGNRLVVYELDENYFPTPDGVLCEDILEKLARIDRPVIKIYAYICLNKSGPGYFMPFLKGENYASRFHMETNSEKSKEIFCRTFGN